MQEPCLYTDLYYTQYNLTSVLIKYLLLVLTETLIGNTSFAEFPVCMRFKSSLPEDKKEEIPQNKLLNKHICPQHLFLSHEIRKHFVLISCSATEHSSILNYGRMPVLTYTHSRVTLWVHSLSNRTSTNRTEIIWNVRENIFGVNSSGTHTNLYDF